MATAGRVLWKREERPTSAVRRRRAPFEGAHSSDDGDSVFIFLKHCFSKTIFAKKKRRKSATSAGCQPVKTGGNAPRRLLDEIVSLLEGVRNTCSDDCRRHRYCRSHPMGMGGKDKRRLCDGDVAHFKALTTAITAIVFYFFETLFL